MQAVLAALARSAGPVPLTELAGQVGQVGQVGLGARRAEKVVERLADVGVATLHDGVVTAADDRDQVEPEPTAPPVAPGTPVQHTTWGAGRVLAADPQELLVVFDSVGYRHRTAAAPTSGLLRVAPAG